MPRTEAHGTRARTRRCRRESGAATLLAVGVICAVLTVTVGALTVLGAVRAAHVARESADLAALAAAGHYQQHADPVAACAEARRIARRQSVQVIACSVGAGGVADVTTSVPLTGGLPGPDSAHGRARAGPR